MPPPGVEIGLFFNNAPMGHRIFSINQKIIIIRSYYATTQAEKFLESHKKATKDEVSELFFGISKKLGHKRFAKKDHKWKDSYVTTIHHYIEPNLVEKIRVGWEVGY